MRELRDSYQADARVAAVAAAIVEDRELVLGACHGGIIPLIIASALARVGDGGGARASLVICGEPQRMVQDLEELGIAAVLLHELDRFQEEEDALDRSGHNRRMAALEAYAAGSVLVANPVAAGQPVPDLGQVAASSLVLRPGQEYDLHLLVDRLVEAGYRATSVVEGRGELAVRGGLIDVYPWIGQEPLRIEFAGDQVDTIRRFDAFTQETIARVDEAVLASSSGGLATCDLWSQLPPRPILVLGDLPLRERLPRPHGRREIRFARQLEPGSIDGASLGVERFTGDLRRGLSELALAAAESDVLILVRNQEAQRDMVAHCADHELTAEVRIGRLSAGFRDQEAGLILVHDFELADRAPIARRARVGGGSPLSSLNDLKRNDYVVHLRHGIGLFRGMATLEKRGFLEDFLVLEFAQGTKLYVPVDAIDLVQKYVGASGREPELSAIGGAAWAKKRAKAEKAILDMSAELLANQARRLAAGGLVCAPDGPDSRRFEAAFPYEETEDQLAAVREIKADMERPVAMDRLLCGDVGFGKTEVAMRAMYKAVANGYQVAVLVPTTLLATQHLRTFTDRFAGTGFVVAGLDRFRSASARGSVLEQAASGSAHILVGTHALLSDKLRFANLGLLVIDEEHRFGVKQKERLKVLRAGCDVLTLSATPIPRTLHFSLLGLRDISVLSEAPAERLAVESRVAVWDDELIRNALERELDRQGQIFVVHNRVSDLEQVAAAFARLVPRLRLDTIHGQMDEERISRTMEAFRAHSLDCLVTTSIIESGIDIPNANTLFVNQAHCFGLAELHQIRGRIGRFTNQAYAYFLVPRQRELGEDARARLDAIQEYAELGAGFKLAMRDLELRGAGNLLGSEQSGQIDAIGYELYTKLLHQTVQDIQAQAVAQARSAPQAAMAGAGAPGASAPAPAASDLKPPSLGAAGSGLGDLRIAVDAYIPDSYLETPALKFDVHKQLDACRRLSDLAAIAVSVRDRYGPLVPPVARLFKLRALRLRCSEWDIGSIEVQERQIRLHLRGPLPAALAQARIPELLHLQVDGKVVMLFLRGALNGSAALDLLCRMFHLDLAFLGQGF